VISVEKLSLRYGPKPAFEGVTLDVPAGKISAIVGPSGCGKTSFLHCLNRLTEMIPGTSLSGVVRLAGQDVAALDVVALRRRVGMIFQKPNPFPLSIRRNLELPLREHGVKDVDPVIERAFRDVGLWDEVKDRLAAPATSLSGGQQQRLAIARALALAPEVLLLDEPCSALDPISSGVVEDLIKSLRPRITQVVVTHNLAQARRIADQVAVFWSGRLLESGPADRVFGAPKDPLTAAYVNGTRG
jgi:phosphate transport system ATP-binding protein